MTNGVRRKQTFKIAALSVILLWATIYYGAFVLLARHHAKQGGPVDETHVYRHPGETPGGSLDAERIGDAFARIDYSLDAVASGLRDVPRLRLSGIPANLSDIPDSDERKSLFLRMLLPLVLSVNESILADRARIEAIAARVTAGRPVPHADRVWVEQIARAYRLGPKARLATLLKRVDVVPPSLALAQSATESGWGTSRFARQGNALFGQWGAPDAKRGQSKAARDIEKVYNVKTFATPEDAVRAYILNLNTHPAYAGFRDARAWQRRHGIEPDGPSLVHTMDGYSELADAYVKALRRIMRGNRLGDFDEARLSEHPASVVF